MLHLQRLEITLSVCAEEPDHSQLFTHLGRMALEFNRLASKVHKNEQRTSILQVRPTMGRGGGVGWQVCSLSASPNPALPGEPGVPGAPPRVMLGADPGLTVQGGKQGQEVVGRLEEEAGNWKTCVGNANVTVGGATWEWAWVLGGSPASSGGRVGIRPAVHHALNPMPEAPFPPPIPPCAVAVTSGSLLGRTGPWSRMVLASGRDFLVCSAV